MDLDDYYYVARSAAIKEQPTDGGMQVLAIVFYPSLDGSGEPCAVVPITVEAMERVANMLTDFSQNLEKPFDQ